MVGTLAALGLSTLVSEDLACITAGVLIARGDVSAASAVLACAMGIFAGDCGLWAVGRFGAGIAPRLQIIARISERWSSSNPESPLRSPVLPGGPPAPYEGLILLASRFAPGTRLPLYVAAGALRMPLARFALWTGLAVALWTPVVVLASAHAGEVGVRTGGSVGWLVAGAIAAVAAISRGARVLADRSQRTSLLNRVRRLRRWEFWPAWLFYAPLVPWVIWLALRYRGLGTMTACNPGIQDGGVVGESKADILARLPPEHTMPSHRITAGEGSDALTAALEQMSTAGWSFPLILKPDVGQRGVGVRLVRSVEQLTAYLSGEPRAVLMQPFHEGPYEAGIFYYRYPHESSGRILSITDKHFPVIVGDGASTVRELIESHPRCRLQAALFLARHASALDTVIPVSERMQLTIAGNHAQGTTFRDGWHLWTPELETRVDAISRQYPGFFIGRFDVRYRDVDAFRSGRDLAIVELNGATAESTNIYDPECSLRTAYRVLFHQWALVFAIGAANRIRGAKPTSTRRLVSLVVRHLLSRDATGPP